MVLQAITEVERKVKSKTHFIKRYGVPSRTLSTSLKNKETSRQAHGKFGSDRKRFVTVKHGGIAEFNSKHQCPIIDCIL